MTTWRLDLLDLAGTVLESDVVYSDLQAKWVLNGPGYFEAVLPWESASTDWEAGERELRLYRDATRIWGGHLWHAAGNGPERTFAVDGSGYYSVMRHRVVTSDLIYADVADVTIAWNLIAHTQAQTDGDLGITNGSHAGTDRHRDRAYCALERPSISEGIEELSQMDDGFDWEISETKVFNTWSPRRGTSSGVTFTGADEIRFDWEDDAQEAASYVSAIGQDDCAPRIIDVSDAAAIARFKRLHSVVEADTNKRSEVTAEANEELRQRKRSMQRANLTYDLEYGPAWGTIGLGDTVDVSLADGPATFDRTYRVVEMALQLEDPDKGYMSLTLDGATT